MFSTYRLQTFCAKRHNKYRFLTHLSIKRAFRSKLFDRQNGANINQFARGITMSWLISGVALWFIAHGFKALFPNTRKKMNEKLGEEKAKGPFALAIFMSFVLIIFGWRHSDPSAGLYQTAEYLDVISGLLITFSIYLFIGSTANIRIRRWIRHPQLTGLGLWSIGHLLTNGEYRSIVLFGGLGIWAVTMMLSINHRDGKHTPPKPGSAKDEIKPVVISLIVVAVLKLTHGFYTAESLIPW